MGRWPLCESRGLEIRRRGLSSWAPLAPSPHTDTQATTVLHPEPRGEQISPQTSVRQALPCPYSSLSDDVGGRLRAGPEPAGRWKQVPARVLWEAEAKLGLSVQGFH